MQRSPCLTAVLGHSKIVLMLDWVVSNVATLGVIDKIRQAEVNDISAA